MGYNIDDKVYTFDDLGKNAPRISYSRKLKKIVLENYEAFWLLLHATKHPDIMNGVVFESDNEFKSYYASKTGDRSVENFKINKFILKEMIEALNVNDQKNDFQGGSSDANERLYITNPSNHENLSDVKIVNSKSSSQNKTKWDAKSKAKNYGTDDRMDLNDYKEWSESEMQNQSGGEDGET